MAHDLLPFEKGRLPHRLDWKDARNSCRSGRVLRRFSVPEISQLRQAKGRGICGESRRVLPRRRSTVLHDGQLPRRPLAVAGTGGRPARSTGRPETRKGNALRWRRDPAYARGGPQLLRLYVAARCLRGSIAEGIG